MRALRLGQWVVRVAAAALSGAVVRLARRIAGKRPRIWHGPHPLHSIKYMVAADRQAGYPSRSVVYNAKQMSYALVTQSDFDRVLEDEGWAWDDVHWVALIDLLLHGDIWVAYFDDLFFHASHRRANAAAFRLLRAAGVRIAVTPHGSDVIRLGLPPTRYDWIARMQRDYPQWDFAAQTPVSQQRVAHFCRFADMVLPTDPVLGRLVPRNDLLFKDFPIDTDEIRPAEAAPRAAPVVMHAPNHRWVKGTDFLLDAVERVRGAGLACELVLVERVARAEALRRYAEADIIADQFCMGGYGQFALEAMALAKPVLTYMDEDHLRNPAFSLPVVNATAENLAAVLAALIALPELRRRLGEAGRAAVERYQSIAPIGEVWDVVYRHLWRGAPLDVSRTRHFSPERSARSLSEDPASEEFWPVAVSDLMPRIAEAVNRLRPA